MIRTCAARLLVVLLTAGAVLVPGVPSSADPAVPGAPAGFRYLDESADSITWQWSPPTVGADDVTGYELQRSTDDGTTWSNLPTTTTDQLQATVPLPTAGHLVWYRAIALSAAGPGPASDGALCMFPGTTSQRFLLRDERGRPLSDGLYRWSDGYGTWSAYEYMGADGIIDLPKVPAGTGMLLETGGFLPSGDDVTKEWSVDMGTDPQTLVVPEAPGMEAHTVKVVLPGGVPVAGVEVNAWYVDGLLDFVEHDGFTYSSTEGFGSTNTNADGLATVRGWSAEGVDFEPPSKHPWPEQAVYVNYQGGGLHDEKVVDFTDPLTTVELSPMPWTTTGPPPDPTDAGQLTPLTFVVHHARTSASASTSGVRVTVRPPAGWSATRCAKRSHLTGIADARGRVHLRVCASRSGAVHVSVQGAVATGPVTVRVHRAAPLPPARVSVANGRAGQLTVSWLRPAYTGGAAVTAYRVQLIADGQRTRTYVLRSSSGLRHVFTGLTRATAWRAHVAAVNRYGTGNVAGSRKVRVL